MHYKNEVIKNQQCIKSTRSSIKQQLQKKFSQDWFKAQNDISDSSRQKSGAPNEDIVENH